jgi:hypothetical protein
MTQTVCLSCVCGQTRLSVEGAPIVTVECFCTSCRVAGGKLEALPGAPKIVEANGATHLVLFRKDRVHFEKGADQLNEHRLTAKSATRRVVATCCNTPIFLEFSKGHWLSIFGGLWPSEQRPAIQMRTMTGDALPGVTLSGDVPNPKSHTFSFMAKLMAAWVGMGFKVPKFDFVRGEIDA